MVEKRFEAEACKPEMLEGVALKPGVETGLKRNLICPKGFEEAMLQGTLEDAESTTFRLEVQLCEEPKLLKTINTTQTTC